MADNKDEKKKRARHTTPKGEALFVHLVAPDYGTREFPDEDGSYSLSLRLNEADADALKQSIAEEISEAKANMQAAFSELSVANRKKLKEPTFVEPGTVEYDRESEEPTGNILFRFKTKAVYKDAKTGQARSRKVPVFDAMQAPVRLRDEPGYGSLVRVAFTAVPYFVSGTGKAGVSLFLDAVQILRLNAAGERSAADYGFAVDEEEGAFTASALEEAQTDAAPTADSKGCVSPDDVPF